MKMQFMTSIFDPGDRLVKDYHQVILLGRSNVGKSSLINSLANMKNLAKVSQMPGKTVSLNIFEIENSIYLVDAPGYGYSKRSKETTYSFSDLIEGYMANEERLAKIYLLMDFKVGPTDLDILTFKSLLKFNIPIGIVFTKIDKVNQKMRSKTMKIVNEHFKFDQKFYISNLNKKGIEELRKDILQFKQEVLKEEE